ncbi:MAG: type I DNA topoisomerase [Deltaproteobacteria bacterium]|nr:type I DNA topoisomerase [Deltaproteobacteria bacterium]
MRAASPASAKKAPPAKKAANKKAKSAVKAAAPKAAKHSKSGIAKKAKAAADDDELDEDLEDEELDEGEGEDEGADTDEGGDGEKKPRKPKKVKPGSALVVVESPAKARTIGKYLGSNYVVKASVGHVRDLPKSKIGVDFDNGFEPIYEVIEGKKKVVAEIRKAARENETVYLASDPDREGEAIAWHISEEIKDVNPNYRRVLINEITKKGVAAAIAAPRDIDMNKTDAQQARRILDRLVGYEISPILWNKVQRGLSAGRVQSVAVRLVCERQEEIKAFRPEEYWSVDTTCRAEQPPEFAARIWRWHGEKAEPKTADEANAIAAELQAGPAVVASVEKKERRKKPQAPFITSRLQQDASRKLRYSAKRTMALAQRLYEGVELGAEGPTGLITYMRTDSTRISDDAITAVREYIKESYGAEYLPEAPNTYGNKERAQDAHEAIRPTLMEWTPERVEQALAEHPEGLELSRLYRLIWNRFVASQMVPAVYDATTIDIDRGAAQLRATGQILKFAGYTKAYEVQETDDAKAEEAESKDRLLPPVEIGDAITLVAVLPEQHFTQPPPKYTEASLVKELEERGIGRPSTYASIMSTIVDRGYVEKDGGRFTPTELGVLVNSLLVVSFPEIVSSDFTAKMESDLDKVEEGNEDWRKLLGTFYLPFKEELEKAKTEMRDVKREEIATDWICEKCGKPMVIKRGRNGWFGACVGYQPPPKKKKKSKKQLAAEAEAAANGNAITAPEPAPELGPDGQPLPVSCRNTCEVVQNVDGTWDRIPPPPPSDEKCEKCSAPMQVKRGRFGSFLACTRYPECTETKAIPLLGIKCPRPGCGGYVAEKRSRRGKPFYGCSNWAKKGCDFVAWDKPVNEPCPVCNAKFVVQKETKLGITKRCMECDWKQGASDESEESNAA